MKTLKLRVNSIKALGFFLIVVTLTFGSVAWYALGEIHQEYEVNTKFVLDAEWDLLRNSLALYLGKAKEEGTFHSEEINEKVLQYFDNDMEAISVALDNYHEENNAIRGIITNQLSGFYFEGIPNDAMDPFVVRGSQIELDNSENCASYGSSRTLEEEYRMHANPCLAQVTFNRLLVADVDNINSSAVDRPLFFQFIDHPRGELIQIGTETTQGHFGKKALLLDSYDMVGLETYFKESQSWEDTFYSFEFVTPSYLFNREDMAGRKYVINGYRTDIPRLSINIVFNFKTVIDNNPILKRDLVKYEYRREFLHDQLLHSERVIYLLMILIILICTAGMKFTNKLAKEEMVHGVGDLHPPANQ